MKVVKTATRLDPAALAADLRRLGKPREAWRVGIELETPGIVASTGRAAPYGSAAGIEGVLRDLAESEGWAPLREDGQLVGLLGEEQALHLEGGGQLELASPPRRSLAALGVDLLAHRRRLASLGAPRGLAWLGLGLQPLSPLREIEWVPKRRYRLLRQFLPSRGAAAEMMMYQSASLQVSLDFSDEEDLRRKLALAARLSPLATALFANSPFREGAPTGLLSTRASGWAQTDPQRAGIPRIALDPRFSAERFVSYALDLPMLYVLRGREMIDARAMTFGRYLKDGMVGAQATLEDWRLHLTGIFTEVRLNGRIEIRSMDSPPPELALSAAAFWKGLLYHERGLSRAEEVAGGWSTGEVEALFRAVPAEGLRARVRGRALNEVARELTAAARESLALQGEEDPEWAGEEDLLRPLEEQVLEAGLTPAERLLERARERPGSLREVILERCGY